MKVISTNKKATHDYSIEETYEAGVQLKGPEVKSILTRGINLKESYIDVKEGEVFLVNAHVSPYEFTKDQLQEPTRVRKLLLKKKQILKLHDAKSKDGYTVVPLKVYVNKNRKIKIEIALAKGLKKYDKRETIKRKEWEREKQRAIKLAR